MVGPLLTLLPCRVFGSIEEKCRAAGCRSQDGPTGGNSARARFVNPEAMAGSVAAGEAR